MTAADRLRASRSEFPVLERCIYMNSNSTGAVPRGVRDVLSSYWDTLASWRDEVWERWWSDLHAYADALAAFVGGPPGSVVTDANLSSLLGRLLGAIDFRERPVVVTTDREFPTMPFLLDAQRRRGVHVRTVASRGACVAVEDLVPSIDERTRLVCLSHASFDTGAIVDIEPVARRAREMGAWLAVDAYQSVGVVPIDVGQWDVDFLLGGAHKWLCGSTETAFMYVHPRRVRELQPPATGWIASLDPLSFGRATEYAPDARRFASGTPAVLPALVSRVGLDLLAGIGIGAIREASLKLTARVLDRAHEAHLDVLTPRAPENRGGIVTLRFPGDARVVAMLKQDGFVCSHRGGVRIAPHFYNTEDEVDRFMDALQKAAREVAA